MEVADDALWGTTSDDDDAVFAAALWLIATADPPLDTTTSLPRSADDGGKSLEVRVKLGRTVDEQPPPPRRVKRGRPRSSSSTSTTSERRNLTKEAIEQLRPLVHKLETQLVTLRHRRSEVWEKGNDRTRVRREAWKAMAERQLVQRRRVEADKQQLLEVLAEQTATLRKLQRIFAHHENRLRAGLYHGLGRSPFVSSVVIGTPGSAEVLQSLTLALDRMHCHTDAVLADARFVSPESSCVEIKTEHEADTDTDTLAVQLMDTRVVPFTMARTANAVWLNLLHRANQKLVNPETKDIVQSQFITNVPGFHGCVEASMAMQRIVDEPNNRVVMVRCSVFAYKGTDASSALTEPMTVHHFLWTAVTRVPDSDADADADANAEGSDNECQIQTCFITVPNLHGTSHPDTATITKLCADVSKSFNAEAHDDVDNILLRSERRS